MRVLLALQCDNASVKGLRLAAGSAPIRRARRTGVTRCGKTRMSSIEHRIGSSAGVENPVKRVDGGSGRRVRVSGRG